MMVTGTGFDPQVHIEKTIARLRGMAGREVLIAVSGGIDSTTSAALLRAAGVPEPASDDRHWVPPARRA